MSFLEPAAYCWGQTVAAYFRWAVPQANIHIKGQRPADSTIWLGWHTTNLLAVGTYSRLDWSRPCHSFVPTGLIGAGVRGWLEGAGLIAAPLPDESTGNPRAALKQLAQTLRQGNDVVIAVDGPYGPAGQVRPGAPWLARLTGCPMVPIGAATQPAFRLPRWDKHIVPLPGATVIIAIGQPIVLERKAKITPTLLAAIAQELNNMTQWAWEILASLR